LVCRCIALLRLDRYRRNADSAIGTGKREDLRATGRVIRAGKTFSVAQMDIRSASGRLVAVGSGTYVSTLKRLPISHAKKGSDLEGRYSDEAGG